MGIKKKEDCTPLNVLIELEKYWCDRHYPLNAMIAGLPKDEFKGEFTVGDMIRMAIKQSKLSD